MQTYKGSRSLSGNPIMRQYELEDLASALLHAFGYRPHLSLKVDAEAFARFMGVTLKKGYISDSEFSLCAVPFEPQTLSTDKGKYTLAFGEALIERSIYDRGDEAMAAYAVMHAVAHLYLHAPESKGIQLSFDLRETESVNHIVCDAGDLLDALEELSGSDEREALADNLAGCLLMPKMPFKLAANAAMKELGINRAGLKGENRGFVAEKLAAQFGVPPFAALLRLKKLLYI